MTSRAGGVWALLGGATWVLARHLVPSGLAHLGEASFETHLVGGCELSLVACAAWAWASTTAVLLGARRGVPQSARRLVLLACGLALCGGLPLPAQGAATDGERGRVVGLPLPQRPTGALALVELTADRAGTSRVVVVRPGDSLWSLAGRHLRAADAWPDLYAANRRLVGPDPDLIHPGQHLRLPPSPKKEPS